jgi:phosphomannomutase
MKFPNHIFKAYDIRGLVEGELSAELAYRIGKSFVTFLREKNTDFEGKSIVVGRDMRESSPAFQNEVIRGMIDMGVSVVDIGLTSTPVFNFACAHYPEYLGGVMITASHNPSEYNGFKITLHDGLPVGKNSGMERLRDLAKQNLFDDGENPGAVITRDVRDDYIEQAFSLVNIENIKPLKVVIDGGNGMGKVTFPRWLEKLPVDVTYLYMEPDGNFPNHEANPLKVETLKDLQAKVLEVGADFGFALDGDADRIGLVDEKGNVVPASEVAIFVGMEILKRNPGIHMLYDLRSSELVHELWEEQGATTEMCMVGHALIKKMMREKDSHFASELSLHLYFKDMHYLESTDLCLLYILEMLSISDKSLSELRVPLNKYVHSGEINFDVEDKDVAIQRVEDSLNGEAITISHLDGLRMDFDWGFLSLRKSNTEAVLRLNLETTSQDLTQKKLVELRALIS